MVGPVAKRVAAGWLVDALGPAESIWRVYARRLVNAAAPLIGMAAAARWFIPVWLIAAGINLWVGVAKAGYSVAEEAPIFLVVFAAPAAVAGSSAASGSASTAETASGELKRSSANSGRASSARPVPRDDWACATKKRRAAELASALRSIRRG